MILIRQADFGNSPKRMQSIAPQGLASGAGLLQEQQAV